MKPDGNPDIIVVGASAGGVEALKTLVSPLPAEFDAAIFVVLHTLATSESLLPQILSKASALPAVNAEDLALVETGKIYVAPPDRHILFNNGSLRVIRGPRENRHRPSIDVLFRSAAGTYGPRTAGILLSGSDDDGTAGVQAIKRHEGVTIVQHPDDSQYPEMPASAMRNAGPDFALRVAEIGDLLRKLVDGRVRVREGPVMEEPAKKTTTEKEGDSQTETTPVGVPSGFTCPDCSGTLWELRDGDLLRYRCRVGHAYSQESMIEASSEAVERALWSAVRSLEESAAISLRIAQNRGILEKEMYQKAAEREEHARIIRKLLLEGTGAQ